MSGKLLIWSTGEYLKLSPMSSSIPFTTQSNADGSKCFKWRKRGANKMYWWVISGKCLQDKYRKYSFIGEDCKTKCAKSRKFVHNVKSMTTSNNWMCRGFLCCRNPMLRFGVLPSVDVACEKCCRCRQKCWFPQTLPTRQPSRCMSTDLTPD